MQSTQTVASDFPDLAAQWHPTKNQDLCPGDVTAGSDKRVWWKCQAGPDHEWQAAIKDRSRGDKCPFCSGKRVSITNSLATLQPAIASQWHPVNNSPLTPDKVVAESNKIVWWKCDQGPDHEWRQRIVKRWFEGGRGCPFCAGKKVSITNCLATRFPDIAAEWHPTKNGGLTPDKVLPGSHEPVWWLCKEDPNHQWLAKPNNRTSPNRAGCPYCSGNLVSVETSLAVRFPEAVAQWHPHKNGNITPADVTAGSERHVWWICPKGPDHEWTAHVKNRAIRGDGCPFCANRRLSVTNSLASVRPDVAEKWHPTNNSELKPTGVITGSGLPCCYFRF